LPLQTMNHLVPNVVWLPAAWANHDAEAADGTGSGLRLPERLVAQLCRAEDDERFLVQWSNRSGDEGKCFIVETCRFFGSAFVVYAHNALDTGNVGGCLDEQVWFRVRQRCERDAYGECGE